LEVAVSDKMPQLQAGYDPLVCLLQQLAGDPKAFQGLRHTDDFGQPSAAQAAAGQENT